MPNLLVIGCGAGIHTVHLPGWTEVTVDTNAASNPTITGDITAAGTVANIKQQYANYFHAIFFENIPAQVFIGTLTKTVILNMIDIVLRTGGSARIRTGAAGASEVKKIKRTFFEWGYTCNVVTPRTESNIVSKYELADEDQGEAYDLAFTKGAAATRVAADV